MFTVCRLWFVVCLRPVRTVMHRNQLVLIPLLLVLLSFNSCKKDEDNSQPIPPISDVPEIEFLGINTTTVHQFTDSLVFSIGYLDGDGDLGFESADSASLYVTDTRFPLTHEYHLAPTAPQGAELTVQGVWNVVLENIIRKNGSASQESATFTIRVRDRAGNWSNEVSSPAVTVLP